MVSKLVVSKMSSSEKSREENLTDEERELDGGESPLMVKSKKPSKAPVTIKSVPPRRRDAREGTAAIDAADECVTLYNERKELMVRKKEINSRIRQITNVINKLEDTILEYLITPDDSGRVPPYLEIHGGGQFYVEYGEKPIRINKDEKLAYLTKTLRARQKDIAKNPDQVARELLDGGKEMQRVPKLKYG